MLDLTASRKLHPALIQFMAGTDLSIEDLLGGPSSDEEPSLAAAPTSAMPDTSTCAPKYKGKRPAIDTVWQPPAHYNGAVRLPTFKDHLKARRRTSIHKYRQMQTSKHARYYHCVSCTGCLALSANKEGPGKTFKLQETQAGPTGAAFVDLFESGAHSGAAIEHTGRGLSAEMKGHVDLLLEKLQGKPKLVQDTLINEKWSGSEADKSKFDIYKQIRARASTLGKHAYKR